MDPHDTNGAEYVDYEDREATDGELLNVVGIFVFYAGIAFLGGVFVLAVIAGAVA